MDVSGLMLIALLAVPTAAAVLVALLGAERRPLIRRISLAVTVLNLVFACALTREYLRAVSDVEMRDKPATFQPVLVPGAEPGSHKTTWNLIDFGSLGAVQFYIGLDGINLWLVLLTAVLMLPSVLISWNSIQERANEYYAWLLLLGTGMLGVFLSFDVILFYVFFELTLVPLFFLIGIWGGPERRHAARKFFIYTLSGSLIFLLALLAVVVVCYRSTHVLTFAIPELVRTVNENLARAQNAEDYAFWQTFQYWVFLAMFAGFAIKVPLFPLHTWLPLAHVEAPTAGSVLLAGVLLKMGTYGFLRLALPLAPDACLTIGLPLVGTLAVVGIIYGALCAMAQEDIKKLVAYSSVSHLGFCMLGMFALNAAGLTGSLLQMINHGLSTGGLFLLVGMLYERYHTRQMSDYGGMGAKLRLLTFCMVVISLSSAGLPGLNGFVGEALVFFGMFDVRPEYAVLGTAGILLGAWYLLTLLKGVFFGPLKEPDHESHGPIFDLDGREIVALAPIMALCLFLGVYPQPVITVAQRDIAIVANIVSKRSEVARAQQPGLEQPRAEAQSRNVGAGDD